MDYVVLDHHHDPNEEVYRLTIGAPIYDEVPMTDGDGNTLLDDDGAVLTERRVVSHAAVEDFVFAADDERWDGADPEEVAEGQRTLVQAALAERDRARAEVAARTAAVKQMPGAGEAL
jgi:hypothetical protein